MRRSWLVGLILLLCSSALADEKVVYLHGATGWTEVNLVASDALASISIGCLGSPGGLLTLGSPATPYSLAQYGSGIIANFDGFLCSPSTVGLADVRVSGTARIATEAVFLDPSGNRALVTIPAITNSRLEASVTPPTRPVLTFSRIENGPTRSTYFGFFTAKAASIDLNVLDGDNHILGVEHVALNAGFTFYRLQTPVTIGRVQVKRVVVVIGCPDCSVITDIYGVAFVGFNDGGSPRVEMGSEQIYFALP